MTLEPVRLAPLLRDTVSRGQALYPGMPLRIDVPDELPILQVDSTRLAQVLDNLLSNADKYAAAPQVTVCARVEGAGGRRPGVGPRTGHPTRAPVAPVRALLPGAGGQEHDPRHGPGSVHLPQDRRGPRRGDQVESVAGGGTCFVFTLAARAAGDSGLGRTLHERPRRRSWSSMTSRAMSG